MSQQRSNEDLLAELDDLLGPDEPKTAAPAQAAPPANSSNIVLQAVEPIARENVDVPDPAVQPERAPEPQAPKAPRILVVDDSKDYRDVVHYLLTEKGYDVETAEDGNDGLQKALQTTPDLILMDFNMPGLNGYELIQELRTRDELRKTPIIMFTGARNRNQLREMHLDIQDFLDKPVSNGKLLSAISKQLKAADSTQQQPPAAAPASNPPPPPAAAPVIEPVSEIVSAPETPPPPPPPAAPPQPAPNIPVVAPPAEEEDCDIEMPEGMPDLEDIEKPNFDDTEELLVDIEKDHDDKEEESGLEDVANDSPLVNRVNKILVAACDMGASDIHIEPQEHEITVRVRLNGSLKHLCSFPSSLSARLAARIKIMTDLVITERRRPQDGQFRATIKGKKVEFRVSILPSMNGEKIVMRILGGNKLTADIENMGMRAYDTEKVSQSLASANGLVLVTGPTGSGKTTTLYTMISTINHPDVNVMTAEDPVEYRLPGITQVPVRPDIGLTFEAVLRAFLRQDPDIMLVGEIRDLETSEIAVKASITGHLVLSTLHTNSAPATITRLTHMGLAPFLVAASVKMIVAQRLVKVLCESCKLQVPLSDEDKKILTEQETANMGDIFRGVGCRECNQTGYTKRMAIFEVMPVKTAEMRSLILAGASVDELTKLACKEGMQNLREAALQAVAQGHTSLNEAMKIILSG